MYRLTEPSTKVTSFSCNPLCGGVPVLPFGVANGLQTVQQILEPFQLAATNGSVAADPYPFHYVDTIVCPSECLNGGGQLGMMDQKTPAQTRE
jgi:hypothetical protein